VSLLGGRRLASDEEGSVLTSGGGGTSEPLLDADGDDGDGDGETGHFKPEGRVGWVVASAMVRII
jgi:hypothetical protein